MLAACQLTLICFLIPHIMIDWAGICTTSLAQSPSMTDIFFSCAALDILNSTTDSEANGAQSKAVRVVLASETRVYIYLYGIGLLIRASLTSPWQNILLECWEFHHNVSSQVMNEKLLHLHFCLRGLTGSTSM